MRPRRLGLGLLAVLSVIPFSASHEAHDGALLHTVVDGGTLAPASSHEIPVIWFEDTPLEATWLFLVVAVAEPGPVEVTLILGDAAVDAWTIAPGATRVGSTILPETGNYTLRFTNPSASAETSYRFYFDQSCACAGKRIPLEIPDGVAVFNVEAEKGQRVVAGLPEPPAYGMRVVAARLTGVEGDWPSDFSELDSSDEGPVHYVSFVAPATERYYFMLEATEVHAANATRAEDHIVIPRIEVQEADASVDAEEADGIPAAGFAAGAIVLLVVGYVAAVLLRPRRQ
ncbi:MAG: hypothetical protein ACT4PT_00690 [Methanobacteriota archaeon]